MKITTTNYTNETKLVEDSRLLAVIMAAHRYIINIEFNEKESPAIPTIRAIR